MSSKPLNSVEPMIGASAHELKCALLALVEQSMRILTERSSYGSFACCDQFMSDLRKIRAQCNAMSDSESMVDVYHISSRLCIISRRIGIVFRNTDINE